MNTNHTPTPWAVDASKYSVSIMAGRFCIAQTATAATGNVHPAESNAAFIVRACNAHDRLTAERDELVAALRAVTECLEAHRFDSDEGESNWAVQEIAAARAALAKAQR